MALDFKRNINLPNIDFKNVYEWPLLGRLFVFALVSLAVFYFGYFFDFSVISGQIVTKFKQEQDLKQQIKSILRTEEDMQEEVSQYPQIMGLLNQWQGQLINGNNLPDLMNQILKIGAANQIQFSIFAPGAKKQQDAYWMVPIKVVMQGSYSQIANFISQVANLTPLVSIGNFIILKQNDSGLEEKKAEDETKASDRLTSELTLEVYYLANKK